MDSCTIIEDLLVRKAERLVETMRRTVDSSDPALVETEAGMMDTLLTSSEFPPRLKPAYRDAANNLHREGQERAVECLLKEAEARARHGFPDDRNRLLARVKEHAAKAVRLGAKGSYRRDVEKRIRAVAAMELDPALRAARRKYRMRAAAAIPPKGIEHRHTMRYTAPVLTVTIDRMQFLTADWSVRGLLLHLGPGNLAFKAGDQVRAEISCPGVEMRHRQSAKVVRIDAIRGTLALSFPDIDPVMLAFLRGLQSIQHQIQDVR
jgi:hypothetical protein